ncbi:MAG: hypothetical protein R2911_18735 [Caldilineaceae bacterium]
MAAVCCPNRRPSANAQVALPAESLEDRELISAYSHPAQTRVEPFARDESPPDELAQYRPRTTVMDRRGFDEPSQTGYGGRESAAPFDPRRQAAEVDDDGEYEGELYDENYRYAEEEFADETARRDFERPVYHRAAAGTYADDADAEQDEDDWDAEDDVAAAAGIMDQYITHYEQGALDYEERRNILNDEADDIGASLGEYGIGVNYKNGILGADPSQVIAMDIWLFDKTDDKNAIYKTQVLLSEYANGQEDLKDALAGDPASGEPVLPTEGMTFQLEGKNLSLDCEILLAEYAEDAEAPGIFDTLEVQFTLRRKDA